MTITAYNPGLAGIGPGGPGTGSSESRENALTALFLRARTGDKQAFSQLYGAHARYIAGVVHRILGNDGDLDDIVQETFIDALSGIGQVTEPRALRAWLVTVAVRRTRRVIGKRRRRAFFGALLRDQSATASNPTDSEPADFLYDAMEKLPADLRIPFALHRIEHLSLPETAEACEVSLATVKRRIADAEERITRRLSP
jgi:RNA polymerase sigma-70 factor (ECF subfamily)